MTQRANAKMSVRMGPVSRLIRRSPWALAVRNAKSISKETIRRVMRVAKPNATGMKRRMESQRHRGNPSTQVFTRNSGR